MLVLSQMCGEVKMTIEQMKKEIRAAGWQYIEHMFHPNDYRDRDGLAECKISLSKSDNPHALDVHSDHYDRKCIGWGRFSQTYCWREAYQAIIVEKKFQ